jgi:hypothetical protein
MVKLSETDNHIMNAWEAFLNKHFLSPDSKDLDKTGRVQTPPVTSKDFGDTIKEGAVDAINTGSDVVAQIAKGITSPSTTTTQSTTRLTQKPFYLT